MPPGNNYGLKYGLVGWWTFNEGTGKQCCDYSGLGNNATAANNVSFVNGVVGYAVSPTSTTLLSASNNGNFPSNSMSISAWFYGPTNAAIVESIVSARTGNTEDSGPIIFLYQNRLQAWATLSGTAWDVQLTCPLALPTNNWTFVTFTFTGGAQNLYTNGVLVTNSAVAGNIVYLNGRKWWFGGDSTGSSVIPGGIDDVRIYNRALSGAEIQQLFNGGIGSP